MLYGHRGHVSVGRIVYRLNILKVPEYNFPKKSEI